jgi:hypothetical protein
MTMLEDFGRRDRVYDQGSAIEDSRPNHRIALNSKEEGSGWIGNEAVIQIKRLLLIVLSRGWEA